MNVKAKPARDENIFGLGEHTATGRRVIHAKPVKKQSADAKL